MLNKDKIFLYCDRLILAFLCLAIFCLPFAKAGVESFVWPAIFIFILKRALGYKAGSAWGMFPKTELNWALGIFVAMNVLALFFSADFGLSCRGLFGKVLKFLAIYFMLIEAVNSKKRLKIVLMAVIASAVLMAFDAGAQYFRGVDFLRGYTWARLTASFISANGFAAWLIVIIPLLLGLLMAGKNIGKALKVLLLLLIILFSLGLLATYARGAWVGFIIGLSFMAWFVISNFSLKIRLLCIAICIGLFAAFFILPNSIQAKVRAIGSISFKQAGDINTRVISILNIKYFTTQVRLGLWKEAIRIAKDYNFTGCGLNTYSIVARDYKSFEGGGVYPHNSYLQMAAETGVPGLASFFWLVFVFFRTGLRYYNRSRDYLLLGLLSGILAFLVQAFFDTHLYSLQLVVLFWFMLGLAVAVMKLDSGSNAL